MFLSGYIYFLYGKQASRNELHLEVIPSWETHAGRTYCMKGQADMEPQYMSAGPL